MPILFTQLTPAPGLRADQLVLPRAGVSHNLLHATRDACALCGRALLRSQSLSSDRPADTDSMSTRSNLASHLEGSTRWELAGGGSESVSAARQTRQGQAGTYIVPRQPNAWVKFAASTMHHHGLLSGVRGVSGVSGASSSIARVGPAAESCWVVMLRGSREAGEGGGGGGGGGGVGGGSPSLPVGEGGLDGGGELDICQCSTIGGYPTKPLLSGRWRPAR